ncbi:Hydrogenase (NiFe) small subunit HydA, partial [human gut metagenome]
MKNRINSLWTLFQERRLSRRTFMKSCVALTAILLYHLTFLKTMKFNKKAVYKKLTFLIYS